MSPRCWIGSCIGWGCFESSCGGVLLSCGAVGGPHGVAIGSCGRSLEASADVLQRVDLDLGGVRKGWLGYGGGSGWVYWVGRLVHFWC